MRKLPLESKTTTFKSLSISKIVHLPIITKVSNVLIEELKKILKNISWDKKKKFKKSRSTYAIITKMIA